jgi:formylglycine-generating enzyme required for sulfatase activity
MSQTNSASPGTFVSPTLPIRVKYLIGVIRLFALAAFVSTALAQEVVIPDAGLRSAIREALQKPAGPLTEQDLLSLTDLAARNRGVRSIEGLEAARNLISLDLQINQLTNFALPATLTNLLDLNLSINPLTNFTLPNGFSNLATLTIESAGLRTLTLPGGLTGLSHLNIAGNQITNFNFLSNLTSLVFLDIGFNSLASFTLPAGLTNLTTFGISGNSLTNIDLPAGAARLKELNLSQNQFADFALPSGMTNLNTLNLFFNQLTNLTFPDDFRNLKELNLDFNQLGRLELAANLASLRVLRLRSNQLTRFTLPPELTRLTLLDISKNPLTNIVLPAGLHELTTLRLSENALTSLTLPVGLTNLVRLNLSLNPLTNLVLPPDLGRLESLNLGGNQFTQITLPSGLAHLTELILTGNQLTNITIPPDMTELVVLGFLGNPLGAFVLPEPLAAKTNLTATIAALEANGVSVFTYPLEIELVRPRSFVGRFQFGITGPPGVYTVLGSTNLSAWSAVGTAKNELGSISFNDVTVNASLAKFYRALRQSPPTNMVFVAPNTFTMGSPFNELHRQTNEGPQTIVTLSGFWIGKYEVTQGEYLSVMNTNPSAFPGDLSRPVSSVSWPDATNYCWMLTQRELAAGRIPAGSQYRLPTEAEWECAARAGTTTRFSYGDDPDYSSLPNYAWQTVDDGLMVHPVGQKLPNPWGLYDMYGNVFEWCQDWLGPLPGGAVTDPQGAPSNPIGWKITRGGGFDFGGPACRSASRSFFPNHPALTDWNLGFRVVLVTEPQ